MKVISAKILCFIIVLTMIFSAAAEAAEFTSAITSLDIDDSGSITMIVNKTSEESGKGIVAVYDISGNLKQIVVSEETNGTGDKTLVFNDVLKTDGEILKSFFWKTENGVMTLEPLSEAFVPEGQPTLEPIQTSAPAPTQSPEPATEGYKATFETDSHASITVSDTQDFTGAKENVLEAYARNSATGEIDTTGEGQVNFKVIVEDGYEVDTVTVSPKNYKNLKDPSELGENTYRITKITGDITVTVTTKEAADPTPTSTIDPDSTPTPGDGIIHLLGDSINADGVENAAVDGTTVTITAAGEYTVEGTLDDGQIVVELPDKAAEATINLSGVDITSTTGAAFAAMEGKVDVSAKKDTVNKLKSTATYTETEEKTPNACLYSRRDLKIKGSGTLFVESSFNNGIGTRGDLTIQKATVNVTATANNGIKGSDSVTVVSGTITVDAVGDALKSDAIVDIQGGTLNLTAGDEGIQAGETETDATTGETVITNGVINISETDETKTAVTITSTGDGINSTEGDITVSGGTVTIKSQTDCMQADNIINISGGEFDLKAYTGAPNTVSANNPEPADSCKGIKAGKLIYISGGTLDINTYDDAIHSNHTVRVKGGNLTIATGDDGVHGDSYLYISDNANINITKSYEGIEAAKIYVNGGETRIVAYDDGANAAGDEPTDAPYDLDTVSVMSVSSVELYGGGGGNQGNQPTGPGGWGGGDSDAAYGYLEINGGYLYVTTSDGDGLDANGNIVINGGVSIVDGATLGSEDGLDFDIGVTFNGGYVFTMTAGGMDSISGTYPQKYLLYGFSGGSNISTGNYCIVDSSNNVLCAFNRSKGSFKRVTFSSPSVTSGTYYIKSLTVPSGTSATDSLYGTINADGYSFTMTSGCTIGSTVGTMTTY